jgi:phosphopantetheinyl transferase
MGTSRMPTQLFIAAEIDYLRSRRETAPTEFFRLWTAKEAVLKTIGQRIYGVDESICGPDRCVSKLQYKLQ